MPNSENRLAVVCGGAMGIGEAIARRFAAEKWHVAIVDRAIDEARKLAQELSGKNPVTAHAADVTSLSEVQRAISEIQQSHAETPLMAAVNSAGIFNIRGRLFQTSPDDFRKLLEVNVLGAFYFCSAVEPLLGQNASIVQIGSINGTLAGGGLAAYKTSKAALHMMTRCIARELAEDQRRIRANVVAPGWVDTPGERRVTASEGKPGLLDDPQSARFIPLKRRTEPREIADTVYFLCSEQGSGITGQVIYVDGGITA
jgi:NAD(P)-dependent dehydrogenase (short-subunit alcohol dehydrogenase family)